jgi:sodium/potassium/calcium exchanger 6
LKLKPNHSLSFPNSTYGVTFLAFGNGAPDVFSAFLASGDLANSESGQGEGFYLAAAGCLGSGFFVASIVSSCVVLYTATQSSGEALLGDARPRPRGEASIAVKPQSFLRDTGFYLLGCLIMIYAMYFKQNFSTGLSIAFLFVYLW